MEDKDPNAFSLPGGKVFINTGLIKMVDNDDELAGILAHEVAHSAHHHVARILKQQEKIEKVRRSGNTGRADGKCQEQRPQ